MNKQSDAIKRIEAAPERTIRAIQADLEPFIIPGAKEAVDHIWKAHLSAWKADFAGQFAGQLLIQSMELQALSVQDDDQASALQTAPARRRRKAHPDAELLYIEDVMAKLSMSESSVRRLVEAEELKAHKIQGKLRFKPEDVDEFLAGLGD